MSRLPHQYPAHRWLFLTWSLHGAFRTAQFPPAGKLSAGQAFVFMDRFLDSARTGPTFLRKPEIAELMVASLLRGEKLGHYELGPFVIMANHAHVVLRPLIATSRLLHDLKGSTARDANLLLDRTGEPFWQRESYDHWVRDETEFGRIRTYVENNPVKAGLVARAEEFLWSSANARWAQHAGKSAGAAR